MDFKAELVKELGLGAIAESTMLEDYIKACEVIAVRYHESEVKKLHIQNIVLEMQNAAMYAHSHNLSRFETRIELQKVKRKWKL